MKRIGWLILAVSLGCGDGGVDSGATTQVCTAIGCGAAATLRSKTLTITEQQIQDSTITVCRNQTCFSASFAAWQAPPTGVGHGIHFPDDAQRETLHTPYIEAIVWHEADGFRLDVRYSPWMIADLRDGDLYDVTLTTSDGTKLVDAHQSLNYLISHPNGERCSPECHSAMGTL